MLPHNAFPPTNLSLSLFALSPFLSPSSPLPLYASVWVALSLSTPRRHALCQWRRGFRNPAVAQSDRLLGHIHLRGFCPFSPRTTFFCCTEPVGFLFLSATQVSDIVSVLLKNNRSFSYMAEAPAYLIYAFLLTWSVCPNTRHSASNSFLVYWNCFILPYKGFLLTTW